MFGSIIFSYFVDSTCSMRLINFDNFGRLSDGYLRHLLLALFLSILSKKRGEVDIHSTESP